MTSARAEQQLILLSASTVARRQALREYAERLVADVDWTRLAVSLRLRKLLPVLGPRIAQLANGAAPGDFVTDVEQALATGRRQGTFLQLICQHVVALLADAGIRSTALKGPHLSDAIYGDPGRRLSSDIDLLVSPEQLQRAVDVVRGLGYELPSDYVQASGLPLLHFVLVHQRGELPPVELHWRVHWYEQDFSRERLLPHGSDSPVGWRPDLVDELAALLLFYARDGFIDLRLASDLSAWWDVYGPELRPGALDDLLGHYPALARVIPVAVEVAERIVGLPGTQILENAYKLTLRQRVAMRLANPNPHTSQAQLYADMGLIDGLLAPPGGLGAFVRRQLLPPPEVLDQHARHAARPRARSRLARGAGVLGRYGLRMTRLVRRPEALAETRRL